MDDIDFEIVMDVEQSWLRIKSIPNYAEVAGEILFRKIFELAPGALSMFAFGTGFVGDDESLYKSDPFKAHARGVVEMLEQAVHMLGPDMEPVLIALSELGDRHVEYGVLPAHYGIVGEALLYTLATALGDGWTPKVKKGWELVYGLVSTAMMAGAARRLKAKQRRRHRRTEKQCPTKDSDDVLKTDYTMPLNKRKNGTEKISTALRLSQITGIRALNKTCPDTRKQEMVSQMLDDALSVISDTSVTSRSTCDTSDPEPAEETVACVLQSWEKIKRIPNYEEVAGVLLFRNIFEIAPQAKELFGFTRKHGDDEKLYKDARFLAHARRVVKMLDVAVDMLGPDLGPVTHALCTLGERHVVYGVTVEHYPIVGQALLRTLEAALGECWTPQVQEGWGAIYGFVSTTMISGATAKISTIECN